MHGMFGLQEASSAVLGLDVWYELLATALGLDWDCSDSVARACLSSQRLESQVFFGGHWFLNLIGWIRHVIHLGCRWVLNSGAG